jgi:hypothetical protein
MTIYQDKERNKDYVNVGISIRHIHLRNSSHLIKRGHDKGMRGLMDRKRKLAEDKDEDKEYDEDKDKNRDKDDDRNTEKISIGTKKDTST